MFPLTAVAPPCGFVSGFFDAASDLFGGALSPIAAVAPPCGFAVGLIDTIWELLDDGATLRYGPLNAGPEVLELGDDFNFCSLESSAQCFKQASKRSAYSHVAASSLLAIRRIPWEICVRISFQVTAHLQTGQVSKAVD